MKKSYAPLAFLALSIAVAGCTALPSGGQDQGTERPFTFTQNDGLSISFSSASAEYFENDGTATFTASLENTGEAQAVVSVGNMEMFGASWAADTGSQPTSSRGEITLQPVERANNLPGGQTSVTFTPSLPESLPEGQSDTYTVGLQTTYEYTSRTRSSMTIMSDSRFQDARGTVGSMQNTVRGAPVQVRFTGTTPRPVRSDRITVPIEISNVGDGDVQERSGGDVTINPAVEGGGATLDCNPGQSGTTASVDLFEGSRTVTCQLTGFSGDVAETTYTLTIDADYGYVESDSTTVTVIGEG